MHRKLCWIGLIALVGCTGTAPDVPKATARTDPAPKSAVAGRLHTLSVPNMT